jgi:uncharacterized phage protein (TIGR02218 family)
LYGENTCRVNQNSYRFSSSVSSVDAGNYTRLQVVGAGGYPNGYFVGGYLKCGVHQRLVIEHTGALIVLIDVVQDLVAGSAVDVWPGCDRTFGTCNSRFGNALNFGGLPYLPVKNPFTGDAIA